MVYYAKLLSSILYKKYTLIFVETECNEIIWEIYTVVLIDI